MNFARASIEMDVIIERTNFCRLVGTGMLAEAYSMTNLFPDTDREAYIDPLGNSLHFRFTRKNPGATNAFPQYQVFMWSNGLNGSNEMGGGDDISVTWSIEVPLEPHQP